MAKPAPQRQERQPGLIVRTLELVIGAILLGFVSLIFNIAIEWLGMAFDWWDQPGASHAREMLLQELAWLGMNFERAMVTPVDFALQTAHLVYGWLFIWSGNDVATGTIATSGARIGEYLIAGVTVVEIFAVRVAVILMSLPLFLVVGLVALTDGLVERELRRWGGGREAGDVFATSKRALAPAIALPILIYLSLPISIHPSLIILPFAGVFAFAIWIASASFKKYFSPW